MKKLWCLCKLWLSFDKCGCIRPKTTNCCIQFN